jgi:hypothetical protein
MKKKLLTLMVCLTSLFAGAQKFDRENLYHSNTHIPSKIIYDQIKTYGVNIVTNNTNQFSLDMNVANSLATNFVSFAKVDFATADLKAYLTFGAFTFIEEKTASETNDVKVDSVIKKVTYYKRVLSFRYPIQYKLVNSKNNTTLYNNEFSANNIRVVSTELFSSEADAIKKMNDNRTNYLNTHINQLCNDFVNPCNASVKDMFDFYPTQNVLDIYRIKKWDKDDEYNEHVKAVMATYKTLTTTDGADVAKEKIKEHIDYFKTFEGVFNPTDKKEDILYFCNYYNLATIYYCLDDFEKAKYYALKLDSSKKQERNTAYLAKLIDIAAGRNLKHFLTSTHLAYNPVIENKLAEKAYTSDAGQVMAASTQSETVTATPAKVYNQTKDNAKVLRYIWLALQCWSTGSNTDYSEPDQFIYTPGTTSIIGQKFLYPVHEIKYKEINLNISDLQIPFATCDESSGKFKIFLIWAEDKLTGIKVDGLSDLDYNLNYDKDGLLTGFTGRQLINKTITSVYTIDYTSDNKLSKITLYQNTDYKKGWVRSYKTYTHTATETIVDCITYGTNRPNTPKGIVSTLQGIYKKSSGNPYIIVQPYGETTEISYNAKDAIEKKIVRKNTTTEEHVYTYETDKLFKETTITKNLNGDFVEKNIVVYFSLTSLGDEVPNYKKTQGNYKFDANDNLVFETSADGVKYRNKVNGVWGEWKFFTY